MAFTPAARKSYNPDVMSLYLVLLTLSLFVIAFLYASVGHAGASGYIAVMFLFNMAASEIRPIALILNILVAGIASWQFWRAEHFSWPLFWPFALFSIPFAFLGGTLDLETHLFKILLGMTLFCSAVRFLSQPPIEADTRPPSRPLSFGVGAGIGLLAGLTGTGGGIFLTPLVIFMRWAHTKRASAVSALFILVNSVSGLLGNVHTTRGVPLLVLPFSVAVVCGGTIGAYLGSRRFTYVLIQRLLAVALTIAGIKLIFT